MNSIIKNGVFLLSLFLFANFSAQSKTENYRVEGNCNMCKTNIEVAAKANKNVESATWDKKTKMLTLSYNYQKTSAKEILQQVAKVGYDNVAYRSADNTYAALEPCCQYKRPNNSGKMTKNCDLNIICELK